jgi:glycosyltransferase involved in cell wall biosynthesis
VAEMLYENLEVHHRKEVDAILIRPSFVFRLSRIPNVGIRGRAFNADRILNRFVHYPRFIRRLRNKFDVFHIVDHSYSHLVHALPYGRTIVSCHDLDTFKSVLDSNRVYKSRPFRAMSKRILRGFQSATVVSCDSCATRDEIIAHKLLSGRRLVVIPNGVHPACSHSVDPIFDQRIGRLLGPKSPDAVELLHVGSTIPRKRIDQLLRVFAAVREQVPSARLIRVGGAFTEAHRDLVKELHIGNTVMVMPYLEPRELAAVYRRATMLIIPSEAEGFGLPVVEAMACGTPVVASDIPALREIGGAATAFCSVGDVAGWRETVLALLAERRDRPLDWQIRSRENLRWAARFSWKEYAARYLSIYRGLAGPLVDMDFRLGPPVQK